MDSNNKSELSSKQLILMMLIIIAFVAALIVPIFYIQDRFGGVAAVVATVVLVYSLPMKWLMRQLSLLIGAPMRAWGYERDEKYTVSFDEQAITFSMKDGVKTALPWLEIRHIYVTKGTQIFVGTFGEFIVDLNAKGMDELQQKIWRMPKFDFTSGTKAIDDAARCINQHQRFLYWSHDSVKSM